MLPFFVICFFAGMSIGLAICVPVVRSSWQSGVKQGYGYGRGERGFDYTEAGEYLRDHCWDEWPELRGDNPLRIHRITAFHEKWEDN